MKNNWIHVWLLAIFLVNILVACERPEILPQNVTATARLMGTDGLGEEVEPVTLQLRSKWVHRAKHWRSRRTESSD